jgi:hypothetical protein
VLVCLLAAGEQIKHKQKIIKVYHSLVIKKEKKIRN